MRSPNAGSFSTALSDAALIEEMMGNLSVSPTHFLPMCCVVSPGNALSKAGGLAIFALGAVMEVKNEIALASAANFHTSCSSHQALH